MLLLPPLIFSSFKLLSMASYGSELVLDSSSPWSGISNHISSFSIPLPVNFKKQWTPLMNKIQGLQASHGATSLTVSQIPCYVNKHTSVCLHLDVAFHWFLKLADSPIFSPATAFQTATSMIISTSLTVEYKLPSISTRAHV